MGPPLRHNSVSEGNMAHNKKTRALVCGEHDDRVVPEALLLEFSRDVAHGLP